MARGLQMDLLHSMHSGQDSLSRSPILAGPAPAGAKPHLPSLTVQRAVGVAGGTLPGDSDGPSLEGLLEVRLVLGPSLKQEHPPSLLGITLTQCSSHPTFLVSGFELCAKCLTHLAPFFFFGLSKRVQDGY